MNLFGNNYYSIFEILILIGDIFAVLNIVQSSASNMRKAVWIVVIVVLPLLGLLIWYFFGPREGRWGR